MKVAVVGANGQLGTDLCTVFREAAFSVSELNHDAIEVSENSSVSEVLTELAPDIVVNTSAKHHVADCESDPVGTFQTNALGPRNLAQACHSLGACLVHISTDYVFDGAKGAPYTEQDIPAPLNVYANSKLAGEHFVASCAERYYVVRVSGLYGHQPCRAKGQNFVQLMLRLASERDEVRVVDNEVLTPTCTVDVAHQLVELVSKQAAFGLYHATAEGCCSWYEFAAEIFDLAGCDVELNKAAPGEFAVEVKRPLYSVLENARLKRQGLNVMPHWKEGLRRFLADEGLCRER